MADCINYCVGGARVVLCLVITKGAVFSGTGMYLCVCVVRVRVRVRTDPESDLWEEEEEALWTVYNM